jgi:hypothetical protein
MLPPELVGEISEYLFSMSPTPIPWQIGRRGFCATIQDLVAFSRVCHSFRGPVERCLYRDIHLNADGWISGKYRRRRSSGGCLHRLLRTLKGRPALGQHVHSVHLDWTSRNEGFMSQPAHRDYICRLQHGFVQLLKHCTSTQKLFLTEFPMDIPKRRYPKSLKITSLGTPCFPDSFKIIADRFESLRELRIHASDDESNNVLDRPLLLQLKKLQLDDLEGDFLEAMDVYADHAEELSIRFRHEYDYTDFTGSPAILPLIGTNLRILRLDTFSILSSMDNKSTRVLRGLPCLEQLYIMKSRPINEEAFTMLPPVLRSLHFPDYSLDTQSNFHPTCRFLRSIRVCLNNRSRVVARLEVIGSLTLEPDITDLKLLKNICDKERVIFQVDNDPQIMHEVGIFCKSYFFYCSHR